MNLNNIYSIILVAAVFLMGCKQKTKAPEESLIDKEKIQSLFDKNPNNVLFNHLYVVLDSSTYAQLRSNTFLNESYAGLDRGMPDFKKINDTVNSIYLRGEKHYLEILGPKNRFKEPVGQVGMGFSLGGPKSFSLKNTPKLKEGGTKFLQGGDTVSFNIKNKERVWYKPFYTFGMKTNLYTWYSYYNPEFLEAIDGKKQDTYTREGYLKKAYDPEKLFKNMVAIILRCNRGDHFRIARELELLGCTLEKKEGDDLIFKAGDIYLKLILDHKMERSTILQIESSLNGEDNRKLELDNITIKNEGKRSLWMFDAPP